MANQQPVTVLVALTKERSHEIRQALARMKIEVDSNDMVDLDAIDVDKLKKELKSS